MTLADALLTLKNVKPARVKHSLDLFSQTQSDDTDHSLSPIELWPIETAESVRPSKAAQQKPLQFCKIAGPFSVIVYYNEKCQFACWCSNTKCICNTNKWEVRSWPFSCGVYYTNNEHYRLREGA